VADFRDVDPQVGSTFKVPSRGAIRAHSTRAEMSGMTWFPVVNQRRAASVRGSADQRGTFVTSGLAEKFVKVSPSQRDAPASALPNQMFPALSSSMA
jgi:hypothetical protein